MRTPLQEGETLIYETQAHWITIFTAILMLLLSIFLIIMAFFKTSGDFLGKIARGGTCIFVMGAAVYFIYKEICRKHDILGVTDRRLIIEEGFTNLISHESRLDQIHGISIVRPIWGRILNYGDLIIQNTGETRESIYHNRHSPKKLVEIISTGREEWVKKNPPIIPNDDESVGRQGSVEQTKECPFCAEPIKLKAIVCKHCGRDLPQDS